MQMKKSETALSSVRRAIEIVVESGVAGSFQGDRRIQLVLPIRVDTTLDHLDGHIVVGQVGGFGFARIDAAIDLFGFQVVVGLVVRRDGAMEAATVVEPAFDVVQEIRGGDRRLYLLSLI